MRNVVAIAGKELRSYFASPVAYIITGLFALIFGWFYVNSLAWFVERSMGMDQFGGGGSVNVNQDLIKYLLLNATVVMLFLLPMITMRTYAEEKRSGTIELLLTSPVRDIEIILGKFFGALGLYCVMLLVTVLYLAVLFIYGNPEWKPIASAYLGLVLLGGSFISFGLFISSLTKNQIVAGVGTFTLVLMLWIIDWVGDQAGSTVREVVAYLSITKHFEDFAKGVIDTKHVVYYLSFIAFGLFLTAKSVDTERWRG
ncbi:MAG: ABC transporter permease subunit [Acidobacteria bacterium]|nr:ABC transporter permease subunit [Acidobacteriota bacterium]